MGTVPMPQPTAPYFPPAFQVGTNSNNFTSPLQPGLGYYGMGGGGMMNNKGSMMQMNTLNRVMDGTEEVHGQPQPQHHITTTQFVVGGPGMQYFSPSPHPITMTCPHCRNNIITRTQHMTSCLAHIVAAFMCVFGCCCLVCIPYMVDSFKDVEHTCPRPECGRFIGVYKRV